MADDRAVRWLDGTTTQREFAVRLARYCSNLRNWKAKDGKLAIVSRDVASLGGPYVTMTYDNCHTELSQMARFWPLREFAWWPQRHRRNLTRP